MHVAEEVDQEFERIFDPARYVVVVVVVGVPSESRPAISLKVLQYVVFLIPWRRLMWVRPPQPFEPGKAQTALG